MPIFVWIVIAVAPLLLRYSERRKIITLLLVILGLVLNMANLSFYSYAIALPATIGLMAYWAFRDYRAKGAEPS